MNAVKHNITARRAGFLTFAAATAAIALFLEAPSAWAQDHSEHGRGSDNRGGSDKESMRNVSRLKEKRMLTVTGQEDWDSMLSFGPDSSMAEMMIQMMVGGSGMEHMKMAAMKSGMRMGSITDRVPMLGAASDKGAIAGKSSGFPVTVTVTPNPPVVGDNKLDIVVTDASGKPVTGLKLSSAVGMTSMDMGTERPKATEGPDGRYSLPVKFRMKGPWRVTLTSDTPKGMKSSDAVNVPLDFNVGSKDKWSIPAARAKSTAAASKEHAAKEASTNQAPHTSDAKEGTGAPLVKLPEQAPAPQKAIAAAPELAQPARVPSTSASAVLETATTPAPTASSDTGVKIVLDTKPDAVKVGKNILSFTILDPSGKALSGAKVTSSVAMTSMDMGTTHPTAKEGKGGHYTAPVEFSMKGPWRVVVTVQGKGQKPATRSFDFDVKK